LTTPLHYAIAGAETLLGRDLQEQIEDRRLPVRVTLTGTDSGISAVLGHDDDEAAAIILGSLEAEIEGVDVLFLTGTEDTSRNAFEIWKESERKPLIIDLVGHLEDQPEARLGTSGKKFGRGDLCVIPHPAAWVISTLLQTLPGTLQQAVIVAMLPASERGQEGLTELQQQTTGLLNFKTLEKRVFDAQLGFSLLPRYGSEAPVKIEDTEQRVDRHLATLMGKPPLPSLRLIQAPVFHGYSFSLWLEFEKIPAGGEIDEALEAGDIDVRSADLDAPTNTGVVGQQGVTVGVIEQDRNNPRAVWLWAVADNFRVSVDQALDVASRLEVEV
jgi:aspartate-semialdehyde dehydrogenase